MKKNLNVNFPCRQEVFEKKAEEIQEKSLQSYQNFPPPYHFSMSEGIEMAIEALDNDSQTILFDSEKNCCVVVDFNRDSYDFDDDEDEEYESDDEIKLIRQIKANPRRYLAFPKVFSHAVYDFMLEFSENQPQKIQWALKNALAETHPMSAFNRVAEEYDVHADWLGFQYKKKPTSSKRGSKETLSPSRKI